ncbi:MAG: DUF1697 domain-containing protein [Prevotellaceae bacterium]|jgi:uncharacterized protein (DUF1697 family)|nr:DUF1697 domain-containing protein [Prevotellaceae bacterium]
MKKIKYVALLRGINVGGNNVIKMDRLKILFEEMNFSGVKTYIQSGNVIFNDIENNKSKIKKTVERKLFDELKNEVSTVLLTSAEMNEIIDRKPDSFGEDSENYKYDVFYPIEPLTTEEAVKEFDTRENVDKIYIGKNVLYMSRLKEELSKSRISKIIESKIYSKLTVRNWNTTKKLYEIIKME